ncbi:hypothetical protein Taro_005094 [Colocasia esculenta]|uniref:Uncharacterized protein n=1 Tax=Colocasia esculenta TaxID=4460 RepID=A0A843TP60_COLES|nr:hypothetical protein [Colocasia esculenta]
MVEGFPWRTPEPLLVSSRVDGGERKKASAWGAMFTGEKGDIESILGREFAAESRKLSYLVRPAIFTSIFQYSFGAVTQMVVAQVGTLELATVSV